jgi:hypothetical protein
VKAKVQVITDTEGVVLAMAPASIAVKSERGEGPTSVHMVAGPGQHRRVLEIDSKVAALELVEIQKRFRVDLVGEPQLIERERQVKAKQ